MRSLAQTDRYPAIAASPPDVRLGYALPVGCAQILGCAPGPGYALSVFVRPEAGRGAQPQDGELLSARRSPAAHQAAKPLEARTQDALNPLFSATV